MTKRDLDYAVMPLAGLWWAEDMSAFSAADKSRWKWTMMIMQADFVSADVIAKAVFNERSGLRGKHHEIYLSDIRRADPKKWKTIIRQPML